MIHRLHSVGFRGVDIVGFIHIANLPDQADGAYCLGPLSTFHNPYYHY